MMDPNSTADGPRFDVQRLRQLIGAYLEGDISRSEQAELEEILSSTDAARARYLEDLCVHAGLEWEIGARGILATLIESCRRDDTEPSALAVADPQPARTKSPARQFVRRALPLTIAASLLLAFGIFLFSYVRGQRDQSQVAQQTGPMSSTAESPLAIATISPLSQDCRWIFEKESVFKKQGPGIRSKVHTGETLRVTVGTLKLAFDRGIAVTLKAPAILEVVSPMRGRLIRGRAMVNVGAGGEGFTIDTPRTSIVDLGTDFGVEVDDFGRTDVAVFSGMVDVAFAREVANTAGAEVGTQRLTMGEAVRIDERGTLSRIISLVSDHFATDGTDIARGRSHAPVISSVRDNIEREDAWNFYEIVPGGMHEDVKAFVDRTHHEWNGVDATGMPEYLVGGDYVKPFNDDKNIGNIELFVTLDRPATLYVLWCKRIEPPAWLREEFVDTGDVIGVDEGRHVFGDGTVHERGIPGVGPGVSVDSIHSIWRREVLSPTTVQLGPTETTGFNLNMYGIVAVPLNDRVP